MGQISSRRHQPDPKRALERRCHVRPVVDQWVLFPEKILTESEDYDHRRNFLDVCKTIERSCFDNQVWTFGKAADPSRTVKRDSS